MNLRKLTVIGGVVVAVSFWTFFYQVFASDQASWDGKKVEEENSAFIEEVSVLQGVIAHMLQDIGVTKKYCNQKGCWESINDGQSLSFESSERKTMWSSLNYGQSLEWADGEGTHWESLNEGQSLRYENATRVKWASANLGQSIEFIDGQGNTWESVNHGQLLRYEGINGKWESANYGQRLEYDDASKQWESLNDGQSTNYDDSAGNSWSTANGNVQRNGNED